jgi:regulatory protein YycH of two-component signal transduction system YycFG
MYTSRENAISESVSAIIRGISAHRNDFVQVTMAQTDRNPATITDNKGTVFETAFTDQGFTYFVGTYQEDGLSYTLYIDGIKVDLMKLQ